MRSRKKSFFALPLLLLFLFLAFCLALVLVDVALVLVAALVTIAEYYVCSVSDRVMRSVLAICRCIAPCARCQDLFNPKKHTRVEMLRDELSKMWRGSSLEARKKTRKNKRGKNVDKMKTTLKSLDFLEKNAN